MVECPRCGGSLIQDYDGIRCLVCSRHDYELWPEKFEIRRGKVIEIDKEKAGKR